MLSIIPHGKIYLAVSGALVVLSLAAIAVWGLKLDIDFTGGSLWEVKFENVPPQNAKILAALADYK
ncbi:MAG: protein translocase subunit SecF, partial [Patescibacteria group bacterium]